MQRAAGALGRVRIVCHHDDRLAVLSIERLQQVEDLVAGLSVQIAGWLVAQEQRVGIARAIVTDPTLLLCDEPTGDLDRKAGDEILDLLQSLNRDQGKTIVMVTHDPHAAERAKRTLHLEKGVLMRGDA